MADLTSFEQLEQAIGDVLDAQTTEFFKLADMLGLDPTQDFVGADLSDTDFSSEYLAGANFTGTDLRGADLERAKLQGANFTNADLGVLPSSYLARLKEINYLIINARDLAIERAHTLARDFDDDMTSGFPSTSYFAIDSYADPLAVERALAFAVALECTRALVLDLALVLDRVLDSVINLALGLDDLDEIRALERNGVYMRWDPPYPTSDHRSECIRAIGLGANLYRANLTGVVLDGANVEGALMIGCTGLSSSQITDLKRRGAIFDIPIDD
ncbi:pentapeptide repeat-containing protein [Trichocoleus desertorum AS-A10]|uniref:pentapeptide repeat-containing protein n=1 Tax=Trichocoleus desertorum TaxID=1481672 RepID=UPI00329A0376